MAERLGKRSGGGGLGGERGGGGGGALANENRKLMDALSRMYSPMPTKYMTWAMPKRGAMTRALQAAPFRKAAGPSFLMILLQTQGDRHTLPRRQRPRGLTADRHTQEVAN